MIQKKRIETIQLLIHASPVVHDPMYNKIKAEFNEVADISKMSPVQRRCLYQVLHSTRALDSTLKSFLTIKNIHFSNPTLKDYLHGLTKHIVPEMRRLSKHEKTYFVKTIVWNRNRYMHVAGANPTREKEVDQLLTEMHDCLQRILGL